MNEDIRHFARLGLVHHLLYPDIMKDPEYHVETLLEFVKRDDIETLDCCIPYGEQWRKDVIPALKNCGKEVVLAAHLFPVNKISLASILPNEQGILRIVFQDLVRLVGAIGASGFVFASGPLAPNAAIDLSKKAFGDFCFWLCTQLKQYNAYGLLEPFDWDVDKKFLYGPTAECVLLIQSLKPEITNCGIELDFAHLPLMGEDFRYAVKTTAPYLKRVHLGNCVFKNTANPFYGDKHPPIGIEDGEIDVPELIEILGHLLEAGYLSRENRGALVLEMRPFPHSSVDETIADTMDRLHEAWNRI